MSASPWFRDGLRFECTGCGDCCTGAPGVVWVNQEEIEALAARLGLASDEFERQYVRKAGVRKSLVEYANGDCVFFDGMTRRCTVYEHRPQQCRTWPFWESNIKTAAAWKKTCEVCPGSGTGKVYSVEEVLGQSAVIKM